MIIDQLRSNYISDRVKQVDKDFLAFEEDLSKKEDLELLLKLKIKNTKRLPNPHNSILLYVLGLTDQFDFQKERSDTVDGSSPDIDMDFDSVDRWKALQWVVDHWGRENIAQIGTFQVFKPKGMAEDWLRVHEEPAAAVSTIKALIPDDKYGKTATVKDILDAHPDFATKFPSFYNAATKLENMVSTDGIHAAGIVISDQPVSNIVPIRMKKDNLDRFNPTKVEKWITQFDMKDLEALGVLKFDFLGIENLSIVKETCKLIKKNHKKDLAPYEIEDYDEKTYALLEQGMTTGVFQMETSGSAKDLLVKIQPRSISELSDISALNRPGPMQAGLHTQYIDNKRTGYAPDDLPPQVAKVLKDTYWTLVYQEQVMKLGVDLAGFTLLEAENLRRAMGKKDAKILAQWETKFVEGCVKVGGLTERYAKELWVILAGDGTERNHGFADYCLAAGTKVQVYSQDNKVVNQPIESIEIGTALPSYAPPYTSGYVTQFHDNGIQQCNTYLFEDQTSVICTPNHLFLGEDGQWYEIEEAFRQGVSLKN